MSFKLIDQYKTQQGKRIIQIQTVEGLPHLITSEVDEQLHEWDTMTSEDFIGVALEAFYRKFMVGKFLNDAVELAEKKVKEAELLADQIKESTELIASLNVAKQELEAKVKALDVAIEKSEQATEKNNELIKMVSLTINELVATYMGGDEADEDVEEDTELEEGGEGSDD